MSDGVQHGVPNDCHINGTWLGLCRYLVSKSCSRFYGSTEPLIKSGKETEVFRNTLNNQADL